MRSYLVGLDGSPLAEATLPYAQALARATDTRLVLIQAVTESDEMSPPGLTPTSEDNILTFQWGPTNAAQLAADEYLSGLAQQLRDKGIAVQTVVKNGEPADILLDECREQGADLILLGTHGRSGVNRLLYGSVAEAVLRRTTVPLLLIPARSVHAEHSSLAQILIVPLDGSPLAEAALPEALSLAQTLHAEIRLIRIITPSATMLLAEGAVFPAVSSSDIIGTEEDVAEKYLQQIVERIHVLGVAASYSVSFDQPGPAIRRIAHGLPASMIVMATHARGGLSRALLGSVAVDVVRHGTVPILLVRPSGVVVEDQAPVARSAGSR